MFCEKRFGIALHAWCLERFLLEPRRSQPRSKFLFSAQSSVPRTTPYLQDNFSRVIFATLEVSFA